MYVPLNVLDHVVEMSPVCRRDGEDQTSPQSDGLAAERNDLVILLDRRQTIWKGCVSSFRLQETQRTAPPPLVPPRPPSPVPSSRGAQRPFEDCNVLPSSLHRMFATADSASKPQRGRGEEEGGGGRRGESENMELPCGRKQTFLSYDSCLTTIQSIQSSRGPRLLFLGGDGKAAPAHSDATQ